MRIFRIAARGFIAVAILALPLSVAQTQTLSAPSLTDTARRLFLDRGLRGGIVLHDAASGVPIATAYSDSGVSSGLLPLSTTKVLLALLALKHHIPFNADTLLVEGSDAAGRALALTVQREVGRKAVIAELGQLGFPACTPDRVADCTTLHASTPDTAWASSFSLGESGFRVTLSGLSDLLRAAAGFRPDVVQPSIARQMIPVLYKVVQHGTGRGIRDSLARAGRIGGKTGSTGMPPTPFDGIFAGIVADAHGRIRYTFATFVERAGVGGGVAAQISAAVAKLALTADARVDACFLLYDATASREISKGRSSLCHTRVSPASTYKIAHALAALDARVVTGPAELMHNDAMTGTSPQAARDQTLASAMHWSAVWYYQRVAERLGLDRERLYLRRFSYGNADPSSGLTTFWNGGSLEISPAEQEDFLIRLFQNKLPVSANAMEAVQLMLAEPPGVITNATGEHVFLRPWPQGATLQAKSGATRDPRGRSIRWLVGRISRERQAFIFVACVVGNQQLPLDAAIAFAATSLQGPGSFP